MAGLSVSSSRMYDRRPDISLPFLPVFLSVGVECAREGGCVCGRGEQRKEGEKELVEVCT